MSVSIRLNNLRWKYGEREILKGICTTLKERSFTAIIGPNGSGKTTLLRNILKTLEPEVNSVFIADTDVMDLARRDLARILGYVPQGAKIDFNFSVFDIVLMGRTPHLKRFQNEDERDMAIARHAMEITEVWYLRDQQINEVSGGEAQRVVIARALAQEPKVLILDEPTAHLDLHHQIDIMNMVANQCKDKDITAVTVLHDLNLAFEYSDHVVLLNDGSIFMEGEPEEVLTAENIRKVYGIDISITHNPATGKPHIIPDYSG